MTLCYPAAKMLIEIIPVRDLEICLRRKRDRKARVCCVETPVKIVARAKGETRIILEKLEAYASVSLSG